MRGLIRRIQQTGWRSSRSLSAIVAATGLALVISATTARAEEEPDFFTFAAGVYDINDDETAGDFRVEYRSDLRFWEIMPFVGLMVTTDQAVYGYAGFGLDLFFGRRVVLSPTAAFGAYSDGDGKELGGTLEFRTGAELAWRFDDYSRLGLALHHISNASIYNSNPGTEMLVLTYSVPFTKAR